MSAEQLASRILAEKIPFYTPRDLISMTTAEPDWIVRGYAACEAITEIDGKIKTSGKTTLVLDMIAALTNGQPWLGLPTSRTKVVYVTEQQAGPFRVAIDRARLHDSDRLAIVFRRDLVGIPWPEVVRRARDHAAEIGAKMIVFDTIAKLAGVKDENDASGWSAALTPLQDLAGDGFSVVMCRHSKKGTSEVGEAGRGSSAASGDVDIIVDLRRPEGNHQPTHRMLESLSRYDETPDKLHINMTDEGYVPLGSDEAVSIAETQRWLRETLGTATEPLSMNELIEASRQDDGPNRPAIQRAINALEKLGEVTQSGAGKRGDPFLFALVEAAPARPAKMSAEEMREQLRVVSP